LVLAVALFVHDGLEPIGRLLATAGWGLVLAGLFHVVPMIVNAQAWKVLLVPTARTSLAVMSAAVWIRESVNGLLPVARIGGEIACYRSLVQRGTPRVAVAASLIVDMAVSLLSQGVFCLVGVGLLVARGLDDRFAVQLGLAFVVLVALGGVFAVLQRAGLFERLARLANRLVAGRWDDLEQYSARIDRATRLIYRRRGRVVACLAWQLLGWLLGAGEIWLALHFLGHPTSLADALILEGIVQAISSVAFVVPGALGVQEGGFLVLGAALGLAGPTALALAVARRIRDAVIFFPGLLAWQWFERRSSADSSTRAQEPRGSASR
ncbi:MAG: lysylphosphatidylglycerol synthase domain-containing protein, partial [Pseudomonadota bacterium]|nr:lysylphosphatidylglycerol synthase domain-containing protein [Pseudomonadota bacterium]